LTKRYGYPKIKSPISGSKIAVGKVTYNKLIKEGMSENYLLSLLNINDEKMNNKNIISDEKMNEKTQLLPNDVMYEISKHLKMNDLLGFCMVNKQFKKLCENNQNLNIFRNSIKYKTLACGYGNTYIIKNDKLYGIGTNAHGQLALGIQSKGYGVSLKEMTIPNSYIPLSVSCGSNHTLVLTLDGLYGCGRNHCGQLTGYDKHYLVLTKIETPGKVLSIACGDDTSYIITTQGLYYTGRLVNNIHQFTKIDIDNPLMVTCSNTHTAVLTTDSVYWFGHMPQDGKMYLKQLINLTNVLDVSSGTGYTMILTTNGLYGIGHNSYGQLGIGNKSYYEPNPVLIPIDNVKHISCKYLTTFILKNDGTVYTCGENPRITKEETYYLLLPTQTSLTNVVSIVSSHEHTVFLKEDGSYHGIGSNYHHQLGKCSKNSNIIRNDLYKI
jgi:alpha-tubulin suppressor-like RCC1 family protein